MPLNLKIGEYRSLDPAKDPMLRNWVGYEQGLTDQEIYEQNRGIWFLGRRASSEEIATFSYEGHIKVVIALDDIENIPSLEGERDKKALVGRVLERGDPSYDALIGQPVDGFRNPVTYVTAPLSAVRTCACGCGGDVTGGRAFLPGHDQRAIHERITQEWGTTLGFIEWFDGTYGVPSNPLSKK